MASGLNDTTIRDFGGGWNVSDSDLNLNSRYQPVSDNVVRGVDGSFSVRQGMALHADFRDGSEETRTGTFTLETTDTSPAVEVTLAAHGLANGDHITISGVVAAIGGIAPEYINRTHSIVVVDTDTVKFYARVAATATGSGAVDDLTIVLDTHLLGGNIIHDQYFNRRLLVFTDIGEIGTIDESAVKTRIWGADIAEQISSGLVPTRQCKHWSSSTFKSSVIACNGYNNDKPLQIFDDFDVQFLVDKATSSNSAVPCADYVVCLQGYVVFVRTQYGDPFLEFSARGTDGTFTRETDPADAAEVDLSMITDTVEPVLLGAAPLRDKLYAAFYDRGMIGTLGIYDESGHHNPDFGDTISENGTVSHRTMVPLGNDVLMCDYAGVPSVSISQQSGIFLPVRLSELIAPAIQKHLASLSEDTLRSKAFATYNRNDRSYMLFLPIYDEVSRALPTDPLVFNDDVRALHWAFMRVPGHTLFENSYVTVAGASAVGGLSADDINGVRRIVSVVDEDGVIIELGGAPTSGDITSGGGNITITPVNNETIGYVFEYNKEFKIRRWTRYRGWDFDCGCSSQRGKVFFAKGLKVYRMGDNELPVWADFVDDYDETAWENSHTYTAGTRVKGGDGLIYQALVDHESSATGSFADDREAHEDWWEVYEGTPISWALETPWSDMKERGRFKVNKYISLDSEGFDRFTVSAFTNKISRKPTTNELNPVRSMTFQAGDTGGWGIQYPGNFGGGRRTREQKLWPFDLRGKLVRWRYEGQTKQRVRIISQTMYYRLGNIR